MNRRIGRRVVLAAAVAAAALGGLSAPATAAPAEVAPYAFPVRPGTAEWAALGTHEDMVGATQLPLGTAETMSTEALVATVLDYPLLPDALAFDSVQQGMETVISRFNGLEELVGRPDAGAVLLARYRAFDAAIPAKADELTAGDHALAAWKLEMLLAQPRVLGTLSPAQLDSVLRAGLDKFEVKRANDSVYGGSGLEPTSVLLGRALATVESWDWKTSALLRDGVARHADAVHEIAALSSRHFAEQGVQHVPGIQDYAATVYTPRGSAVAVTVMTFELTAAQISSYNSYVATNYPSATRETNASRMYNCHSYAWYSTSTANNVWMNTPGDDKYWLDGSYTQWHTPYIWFSGMKLSYASDDHSGIWVGTSSYVRSKWGQLPRMYHYWNYSPYNASVTYSYFLT